MKIVDIKGKQSNFNTHLLSNQHAMYWKQRQLLKNKCIRMDLSTVPS